MEEATYRQIVDGAPDGIVLADAHGTILYWNAGATAIFGFTATEAIGQSLNIIIPEAQRDRHWTGYRRVMATGETRYARDLLAVPGLHRDGHRLSIEFHVVLVRDAAGTPSGIAAIIRDVTERWREAQTARRRLQALEAEIARRAGGESSGS
jgi:nitric oxide dioxygenase